MTATGVVPSAHRRWRLWALIPLCLVLWMLSACAPPVTRDATVECPAAVVPEQPSNVEPVVTDTASVQRLETKVDRQRQQIMRLELQLLAKQSEIQVLSSVEREAVQEVVRAKAKLRSLNSKAETVANLAEVKLTLQGMSTDREGQIPPERLEQAQHYVDMSEAALEEGNVDGAAYLIGQARSYLMTPETPTDPAFAGDDQLRRFLVPVSMTLKRTANVRTGPGTKSEVMTMLNAGTSVTATGYAGLWVRVVLDGDAVGWIHYGLLERTP